MSTWEYILARLGDICSASSMNANDLNRLFFLIVNVMHVPFCTCASGRTAKSLQKCFV